MKIEIRHDDGGDWVALYRDGAKVYEGHSMTPEMVLDAIEQPYTRIEVPYEEAQQGEGFPEKLW